MLRIAILLTALLALPCSALAFDYAQSDCDDADATTRCSPDATYTEIEAAAIVCNNDASCTTLYVPAGTETWTNDADIPTLAHDMSVIGAGPASTVITLANGIPGIIAETCEGHYFRISGFRFNFDNASSSYGFSIKRTWHGGFRVDNCYFYGHGSTAGVAGATKLVWRGLFDNNTIEDSNPVAYGPYGFTAGSPSINQPACTDWEDAGCVADWNDDWWDNDTEHPGQAFDEDYVPGTVNAIFVENNTFINTRSSIMWNWSAKTPLVARYNTFTTSQSEIFGVSPKPGSPWADIYNNTFIHTSGGIGGTAHYIRTSATIHDNAYTNLTLPGTVEVYSGFDYDYLWTLQTQNDEFYAWDNIFTNCTYTDDCIDQGDPGDANCAWQDDGRGFNPQGITYYSGHVIRKPAIASGDRFDYVEYTCPHPLTGLSGTCDDTKQGPDGYDVSGEEPPTPPATATAITGCTLTVEIE